MKLTHDMRIQVGAIDNYCDSATVNCGKGLTQPSPKLHQAVAAL